MPDDAADLDNPRDERGHILCSICAKRITAAEPIFRVGDHALHFRCHERRENEPTGGAARGDSD